MKIPRQVYEYEAFKKEFKRKYRKRVTPCSVCMDYFENETMYQHNKYVFVFPDGGQIIQSWYCPDCYQAKLESMIAKIGGEATGRIHKVRG